jgi:hypothetical protein
MILRKVFIYTMPEEDPELDRLMLESEERARSGVRLLVKAAHNRLSSGIPKVKIKGLNQPMLASLINQKTDKHLSVEMPNSQSKH